jgi:hypothetical protein
MIQTAACPSDAAPAAAAVGAAKTANRWLCRQTQARGWVMAEPRVPIPDPVLREVRQRCGFGCIICGLPLYEYHHIDENRENNVAANITLLCDRHHKEATNRLLAPEQVADANKQPYNLQHGTSSPYGLHFQGKSFHCVVGGNTFSSRLRDHENATQAIAISIDDTDLLWFRIDHSGNLFLTANIFDENNLPLLVIRENELMYRPATWDVEFKGRKLTLREAARKILFEIEFKPPQEVAVERARLLCNGIEILVRRSHIFVVNSQQLLVKCKADNCDVGLQLGRNQRGLAAGFASNPEALSRYHMLPEEVRRREREALKRMEQVLGQLDVPLDTESLT